MSWNQGDHAGPAIQAVVRAFYAGKHCTRGNAFTNGTAYSIFGNVIARRNPNYRVEDEVAAKLLGEPYAPRLEFRWHTLSATTQRHLKALGLDCYRGCKGGWGAIPQPPQFRGREVKDDIWYSDRMIEELPLWTPPVKKPRAAKFVNLTAPLFA